MTAPDAGHEHDEVTPDPGTAAGGAGDTGAEAGSDEEHPTIVVRDRRRVDQQGTARQPAAAGAGAAADAGAAESGAAADTEDSTADSGAPAGDDAEPAVNTPAEPEGRTADGGDSETGTGKEESGVGTGETTIDLDLTAAADAPDGTDGAGAGDGQIDTELARLRRDIGELTRDLQRVTAEYANYRKRVDRDRTLASEQATGAVLGALIPVLDDLDRARAHGDLVGPFAAVADQLSAALGKFGLTAFGETGDPFDPTVHEAVSHTSSPDVTQTTCVEVMRRGYLLGERLLRPALVAVADPE